MTVHPEEYDCAVLNRVRERLWRRSQNWMACFGGPPGMSKSMSSIAAAFYITGGREECIHILFSAKEFIRLINSGKLKRGDVVVYDDPTDYTSRESMKRRNRNIGRILQTFREANNVALIFTIPVIGWLDSTGRALFTNYFEALSIDYKNRLARFRVFNVSYNPRSKKTYFKAPMRRMPSGKKGKIKYLEFELPPEAFVKAYRKRKKEHLDRLNLKIEEEMGDEERKEQGIKTEKGPTKKWLIIKDLQDGKNPDGTPLTALQIAKKHKTLLNYVYMVRREMPTENITESDVE
jgi:hypothetical protein